MGVFAKPTPLFFHLLIVAVFLASRVIFHLLGVTWDGTFMQWGWQVLDAHLLRDQLGESLWYLHSQPPGFNLLIGLCIKLSPGHYQQWLQGIFLVGALLMHLSIWQVQRWLGVRTWIALTISLLFLLSPSAVAYERWLFYSHPTVVLLSFSLVALVRFLQVRKFGWGLAFFLLLAAVVFTRTAFQWFWFAAVVAALFLRLRGSRRLVLTSALAPTLLIAGLLLKNYVLFGFWGTTSWTGMNLAKMPLFAKEYPEVFQVFEESGTPSILQQYPFASIQEYRHLNYAMVNPHPEAEALDESPLPGRNNYNHHGYIALSRLYLEAFKTWISQHPDIYLSVVKQAQYYYFQPASSYDYVATTNEHYPVYNKLYNHLVLGCIKEPESQKVGGAWGEWPITQTLAYNVLIAYAGVTFLALRGLWRRRRGFISQVGTREVVAAFAFCTCAYLLAIGTMTEIGENMRFRFLSYPFGWLLVALALEWVAVKIRAIRQGRKPMAA